MANAITGKSAAAKAQVIDAAVDELTDLDPREIVAKVAQRRNAKAAQDEADKVHPFTSFSLPTKEWADLKANILDGGGVTDDTDLCRVLLQAVWNDRQDKFWPALFHLLKARGKMTGRIIPLPNGGVTFNGVA